ncbi:glutamate receptor ionotropic, kainate glr-3-like [Cherax quadricarinatus]|uniref:glutamate receptor ionotropic, kainate glr-3-like n=1 Tax=Cherax quadricarinatus TaxID=27406 RepID=UPI002378B078|nr:uncharacterized protein LOC128695507 [Cherax quadricarinatus]
MYDYTYIFDYSPYSFALAKPTLRAQWQSLYYPLSVEVWAAIFVAVILVTVALYLVGVIVFLSLCPILTSNISQITQADMSGQLSKRLGAEFVVIDVVATLLGQGYSRRHPANISNRLLLAVWLIFVFIMGTAYRGTLTASLTLTKTPSRPETVEDLVTTVHRATIESYGTSIKKTLMQSGSSVLVALGTMMVTGVDIVDSLKHSLSEKQAHIGSRNYLEQVIAENFTQADGSTLMYIGRERIAPTMAAWPVPHDAPYKPMFDRSIQALFEAGFPEKWKQDTLRQEASLVKRRKREENDKEITNTSTNSRNNKALTTTHMQGLYGLSIIGLITALVTFVMEIIIGKCYPRA